MQILETKFKDLLVFENNIFSDKRGELRKYFISDIFTDIDFKIDDIYTTSSKNNVIRGMHHQIQPHGQSKLVSCLKGSFIDVALDLRKDSMTYGEHFTYELKSKENKAVLVPPGFSHATISLADDTIMLSICSGKYLPQYENGVDVRSIGLDMDLSRCIISEKDTSLPTLQEILNA